MELNKETFEFPQDLRKRCTCDWIAILKHRYVRNHAFLETRNSRHAGPCTMHQGDYCNLFLKSQAAKLSCLNGGPHTYFPCLLR